MDFCDQGARNDEEATELLQEAVMSSLGNLLGLGFRVQLLGN